MHTLSNYPVWFRMIEEKLQLSHYVDWTYLGCEGAMEGHRKPSPAAYDAVLKHLQLPAAGCIFVNDRKNNVEGAIAAGMDGILFDGVDALKAELRAGGLQFWVGAVA